MDTANYKDFLIFNGGVRYDDYHVSARNNTSSRSADSGIPSYNFGIVYKPVPIASVYAAYATAADPVGDELDATSSSYGGLSPTQNQAQIFGPQKSKAIEVGTKWELFDRHLLASAAAFQTDVTNARETAPAGLPNYTSGTIVAGAQYRVRGLDFEAAGKITDKWSVMAGLVLMQSEVTKSIVPTNVGLELANIAHQSFNLLTKYQVLDWLELGGQAVYASEIKGGSLLAANGNVAYPNPPNPTILPSHWRFDTFAEAKVTDNISAKLYIQNIFDKTYYDALYQSAQPFIQQAPGRNISLIATAKF
jgi:catecholate siderophore receptor